MHVHVHIYKYKCINVLYLCLFRVYVCLYMYIYNARYSNNTGEAISITQGCNYYSFRRRGKIIKQDLEQTFETHLNLSAPR